MVRIHSAFPDDIEDYHPDSFNSTVDPRVFVLFHLIARWGKNALHFHIVELLMTIISDTNEKRTDAYTNSLLCKRII